MKIIGRTESGVIVQATDHEIAQIVGVSYPHEADKDLTRTNDGSYHRSTLFKVGVEIHVSPMWDWMTKAREAFAKITSTAKLLHGVADMLEHAPPQALVEPEGDAHD